MTWGQGIKWGLAALAIIAIFVAVIVPFSCGLAWFSEGARIVSPENVREQYRFFYDTIEDLDAIAVQVCITEGALGDAESRNEREHRRSQLIAYEQNYARVKADYDARAEDVFRGGIVRPRDLPSRVASLAETRVRVC